MKNLFFLFVTAVIVGACTKDVPNPALPDVKKFPIDAVKGFSLVSPSSGLSLNIKPGGQVLAFDWEDATGASTYEWVADITTGDFSNPLIVIASDNSGVDSNLSLTYTQIFDALGTAGVADGQKIDLKWSARAKSGSEVKLASSARNITFQRGGVTFMAYVPANTPAGYDVYLAGSFGFLTGADWQQPGTNPNLKLSKNSDGTYSIILGIPSGQSMQYKFFIAPTGGSSWGGGERDPDGTGTTTNGAGNRSFTYDGTNDLNIQRVSFWEGYDYPYVAFNLTAPVNTPADKDVFVAGEWDKVGAAPGSWQQPGTNANLKMTHTGGQNYYFVVPKPAVSTSFQYKYFIATTTSPDWGHGENGNNRTFTYSGSNNSISDVVASWQ
jgi:hypothetical protein